MGNQFVRLNSHPGKQYQLEESSLSGERPSQDSQVPAGQPQEGESILRLIPQRPSATGGLLSNWKSGTLQDPRVASIPSLISITDQDTLKSAAINAQTIQAQEYIQLRTLPASQPFSQQWVPMYPQPVEAEQLAISTPWTDYEINSPLFVHVPARMGQVYRGNGGKKRRVPIWARIVLSVMLLLIISVGSVAGYYYTTLSVPISHIVNQQVPRIKGEGDPNQGRSGDILSGGRLNILLLGSDTDEKFTNADGSHTYLAQSDIVITIDPSTKSVGMLSIPRDFWINVPGNGMHKLDQAYALGGVALSRQTIEQDFGISINYYAWVGLDGFVKVINTVNGVDVDVIHPITDDNYPDDVGNHTGDIFAMKRLYIAPGPQHLSGPAALEYVRSRHADMVGDFGRSARQQQVLNQLKTKLNNAGIVGKLPELAQDLNGWVRTDMQLSDVFKMMNFARTIDANKINRVILGPPYSALGFSSDGQSIVVPDCKKIVPVIAQMFALGNTAGCNIQANSSHTSIASTSKATSPLNAVTHSLPNDGMATASEITGTMSLSNGSNDLLGIHSLLDLLFLTVFDSPQALQV